MIDDPIEAAMLKKLGLELRDARTAADVSQEAVCDMLGWQHKSALSKVELGERRIQLYEYLKLALYYKTFMPDHPAVALADRFLGKPRKPRLHVV